MKREMKNIKKYRFVLEPEDIPTLKRCLDYCYQMSVTQCVFSDSVRKEIAKLRNELDIIPPVDNSSQTSPTLNKSMEFDSDLNW